MKVSAQEFTRWFECEARAVTALQHPNICTLYDVGPNYLVMEYIEALPRSTAACGRGIAPGGADAEALDAAHRKGFVHRDLRPANIMVTKSGVKVLNFGLAKMKAPAISEETATKALTGEETPPETLQYTSPEQLQGKEADARSDIFSFGLVLYEMLTGKPAFEASSQAMLIGAILHTEPPPVSSLVTSMPPALDRLIRQCIAKDPENRWPKARATLRRNRPGSPRRARNPAYPLTLSREAWNGNAWLGYWTSRLGCWPLARLCRDWPSPRNAAAATTGALPPRSARWSCTVDVRRARAFAGWRQDHGDSRGEGAALDTQSRCVGYASSAWYRRCHWGSVFAGQPFRGVFDRRQRAASRPQWRSGTDFVQLKSVGPFSWSRGVILASEEGVLQRIPESGGAPKPVTTLNTAASETSLLRVVPSGRTPLPVPAVGAISNTVYAGSIDNQRKFRKRILQGTGPAKYALPGWLLFLRDDVLLAQPFDAVKLELSGEAAPVAQQVSGQGELDGFPYTVSETGALAWRLGFGAKTTQLTWLDRTGKSSTRSASLVRSLARHYRPMASVF